ncbi:MAG: hypothetical protein ACFNKF_08790 [Treponema lecithinolyticum]|jgi:lipoprotein|uniref:hypothetical protein n=1 Tax=Treponema lecithinolyticum TaxID=53418 RepID=UPI00360D816E
MKYRNLLWVIVVSVLFVSCRHKEYPRENGMIFYDGWTDGLWIGDQKVDMEPLEQQSEEKLFKNLFFDTGAEKLWAWFLTKDNTTLYLANMTDGKYSPQKELTVSTFEGRQVVSVCAYNDTAVVDYSWSNYHYTGLFGFIDLRTGKQRIVDIRHLVEAIGFHCLQVVGYDGKRIFFDYGWYDMKQEAYYKYPDPWHNDYYLALYAPVIWEVNLDAGEIREYNVETHSYTNNDLVLKKLKGPRRCKIYGEPDALYIGIMARFQFDFLAGGPIKRLWYKFDRTNKTFTRIYSPHKWALILGRIKQKRL